MFDRYQEMEGLLASWQVVLVMLGMGMTLSLGDFGVVFKRPKSLIVGYACQFLLAPLLTALAIVLFDLDQGIAVGLILISAMPGGPLANLFTFLALGNLALSITLTGLATVGSLITVPLILHLFAGTMVDGTIHMPIDAIVMDVTVYLLLPLAIGMAIYRLTPRWAAKASPWLIRLGLVVLLAIVVGSIGSGRIDPLSYGWKTPAVIVGLCLVIQNVSMAIFPILRWPIPDQTAVGIGITIRNVNLALLLAARLFPATATDGRSSLGGGVLYVSLFWGALSLIVCTSSVLVQRRATLAAQSPNQAAKL